MGGGSVLVGVAVAEGSAVGVSVAGGSAVGVSLAGGSSVGVSLVGKAMFVPGEPHENKNRHSTTNSETKRVLDLIFHRLNCIDYPNGLATRCLVGHTSLDCNPFVCAAEMLPLSYLTRISLGRPLVKVFWPGCATHLCKRSITIIHSSSS